jgi:hypothetical protein
MLDLKTATPTSNFGALEQFRRDANLLWHNADDYGADIGTPILAPHDGEVVYSGFGFGTSPGTLGYYTIFDAGLYGLLLAHQDRQYQDLVGDVKQGEPIGFSGNTGWTTGPHVHAIMSTKRFKNGFFDFNREGGGTVSPKAYLNPPYSSAYKDIFGVEAKTGIWAHATRRVLSKAEIPLLDVDAIWYQKPDGIYVSYNTSAPEFVNTSFPAFITAPAAVTVVKD